MNDTKSAYPLQWPPAWPKTEAIKRERGKFQSTLSSALNMLKDEVRLLGGKNLVLSSNCTLGHEKPKDPGVVAYFHYDGNEVAVPCDRWQRVEHNVKAIALTIEAMRGMERWGAKHMIKAMFSGFKALPSSEKNWWDVLQCRADSPPDIIRANYRRLAVDYHPDRGGTNAQMAETVRAGMAEIQTEVAKLVRVDGERKLDLDWDG